MIVRMQHLDLVCLASDREATLERLRALGAVHLEKGDVRTAAVAAVEGEAADAEKAVRLILKLRGKRRDLEIRPREVAEVLGWAVDRDTLLAERDRLDREIRFFAPYGDFDPQLAQKLLDRGIDLSDRLPARLPEARLSKLEEKRMRVANRICLDEERIASADEKIVLARFPGLADRLAFETAKAAMTEAGELCGLSGWVPQPRVEGIREAARQGGWGVLLREPADGETPPTLVEPPRLFRPMKVLFDGLGIAPAYSEADVSVPFMAYFSLFFAMLVGDGAYGLIFLFGTFLMRRKLPRSWLVLLTVFSAATVLWGVLSNTWFGAALPFARNWPTVRWLADPSYRHMMLLCFTIGVSHLMLARIWNGLCKLNDSTCVAEFGWAGVLLFMYFVTNSIVGIFPGIPPTMYAVFGLSLVAVFGFTVKPRELKTRGAELGMLPLNIMSALGDIISYVRLFAVGLASVKVAENFNAMATGLVAGAESVWLKALLAVAMVAILIVGHVLNLAMAGLSILVHAVRLNTLEFSNHKGVSWSGYAYRPFKKQHQST